jgi:hypothetical protein
MMVMSASLNARPYNWVGQRCQGHGGAVVPAANQRNLGRGDPLDGAWMASMPQCSMELFLTTSTPSLITTLVVRNALLQIQGY